LAPLLGERDVKLRPSASPWLVVIQAHHSKVAIDATR
jgi:hypothetical protein